VVGRRCGTVSSTTDPVNLSGFRRRHLHGLLLRPLEVHRTGAPYGCWMPRRKLFPQTRLMCDPTQAGGEGVPSMPRQV